MDVVDQLGDPAIGLDEPRAELLRVRRGVANAFDAGDFGHVLQQQREIDDLAIAHGAPIGVDVLAQQRDFAHALFGQPGHLDQHVVERPRDLFAPGERNDTEAAVLAAPFHDRHEGAGALDPGRRQMVEFFDLGKRDVDLRAAGAPARLYQRRQPMQRLGAEHHVDVRRAGHDVGPFLAGDAAAHPDDQARAFELQSPHAAQVGEGLFFGFFAHRAGVEQDDVRLRRVIGGFEGLALSEHVGHLGRVVLVHLTAEGLDVQLAGHVPDPGSRDAASASAGVSSQISIICPSGSSR